ncbi:Superfamily II helicase and inactivated derivatives [Staphylococcus devriesei]|uniref:DUF927 domain-containing protein n=1 Tax=Staphylococcus haemolyticus TaxID=1283 RepID=A0A1B1UYE9_STAHA|nr:hypothetical protein [Staphylococcus haemolyticus]UII02188.1 hypothetical protein DENEGGJD_00158 [Staphylococcus haemolyticus]SUM02336.1 Superfamily II helicase and inactivated derivatives [Staphylococcus devriesei]
MTQTNPSFNPLPRYKSKKGWYEDKPPKEKGGMPTEVEIAGPIVIKNKFIDPKTNTEKVIITDEDQKVIVESSDILTTQKLPSLMNSTKVFLYYSHYLGVSVI